MLFQEPLRFKDLELTVLAGVNNDGILASNNKLIDANSANRIGGQPPGREYG